MPSGPPEFIPPFIPVTGMMCSYGKNFQPAHRDLGNRASPPSHMNISKGFRGEARSRKPGQPGQPGSYEEARSKLIFENDAIRNRISMTLTPETVHLSTKSAINKPAMNYRTILIAAVFHFVHQVEKDSLKHYKMTQNSLSSSYQ